MDTNIIDQATATGALRKVRDDLQKAIDTADDTTGALRDAIGKARPAGILTVDAIAEAICVLSDAGQQSLKELERYATYQARLAIGLPAAN